MNNAGRWLKNAGKWVLTKLVPVLILMGALLWMFDTEIILKAPLTFVVMSNASMFFAAFFIICLILMGVAKAKHKEDSYNDTKDAHVLSMERWVNQIEKSFRAGNYDRALWMIDDLKRSINNTEQYLQDKTGIAKNSQKCYKDDTKDCDCPGLCRENQ